MQVEFFQLPGMCARDGPVPGSRKNPTGNRVVICFCTVRNLKKRFPLKICIPSCFVRLKNVLLNLLCVFDQDILHKQTTSGKDHGLQVHLSLAFQFHFNNRSSSKIPLDCVNPVENLYIVFQTYMHIQRIYRGSEPDSRWHIQPIHSICRNQDSRCAPTKIVGVPQPR